MMVRLTWVRPLGNVPYRLLTPEFPVLPRHLPRLSVAIVSLLVLVGCSSDSSVPSSPSPSATPGALNVFPAGFDLAVGDGQRFLAGLLTNERELIVGGQVEMSFFYFGEEVDAASQELVAESTATYLPVPGNDELTIDGGPTIAEASSATGVYETTVGFDRPGTWGVGVIATIDGDTQRGTATFVVQPEPQVVAVGEPAPRTNNATVDGDAPRAAIDSRTAVGDEEEIPDPGLHDTTIASAIEAGRPVVVVVSTPVYCESRFCGPITETIEELAESYGDRAEFVHLEVWGDFEGQQLNAAAAEWIETDEGGNEPWVFLVDSDGNLAARWDNVLDLEALETGLEALPVAS